MGERKRRRKSEMSWTNGLVVGLVCYGHDEFQVEIDRWAGMFISLLPVQAANPTCVAE